MDRVNGLVEHTKISDEGKGLGVGENKIPPGGNGCPRGQTSGFVPFLAPNVGIVPQINPIVHFQPIPNNLAIIGVAIDIP